MLAEGIHSVADTGNQGLLFLGGKRSRKAPTAEHQFGFGTRALLLGVHRVARALHPRIDVRHRRRHREAARTPSSSTRRSSPYAVLGIAIVAEGLSLRTARHEADPIRRGRTWWRFVRTTKNPELPVVLLEDTGALVGLVFALVGISLAEITGNARWDAVGSIGIGLLLGVIAIVLAIEMKSLLIGEAASPACRGTASAPRSSTAPR